MTTETKSSRRFQRSPQGWRSAVEPQDPNFGPVEIAACEVVRHLLQTNPDLTQSSAPGRVTVLRVPSADWVVPIQQAWVAALHRKEDDDPETTESAEEFDDSSAVTAAPTWYGFCRDGSIRDHDAAALRRKVWHALHSGMPVYGWSHDPEGLLPRELLRLADRVVPVPPLSAPVLADALTALTGTKPEQPVPAALAAATGLHDLAVAWRPGETADGVLGRLERLLGQAAVAAMPEDRLENLLGMDEARDWGMGVKRDLPAYRAGRLRWADIDRAVLLAGPPGCGKTTFARRMAASCGLPLVTGSPQVWQGSKDGHLGHALAAMQATFRQARVAAPCVLFIDEIDSMGDRASYADHNRDYSTSYMNGLLEQLDGVNDLEGVIVVAACNHPERLDPALVRAGRLDRILHIGFPDETAVAGILRQRLGGDLADADLLHVARRAHRATGADCERWVRGARRRARHAGRAVALDDLVAEVSPPGCDLPEHLRRRAAAHEAGHAVVALLERPGSIVRVSIRQGPISGGYTVSVPEEPLLTRAGLERNLRRLLGGRVAEELLFRSASSGAGGAEESDLAKATLLAATGVMALGLGSGRDIQPLLWRGEPCAATLRRALVEQPAVANEVSAMLAEAHQRAREMLEAHRPALLRVVRALLERETVEAAELAEIIGSPDAVEENRAPSPANAR